MGKEIWKDIAGFEGYYQISNLGQVRALERSTAVHDIRRRNDTLRTEYWRRKTRILKPICIRKGSYVHLYKDGTRKSVMIKRLVAQAFLLDFTNNTLTHNIRLKDISRGPCADNLYISKKSL